MVVGAAMLLAQRFVPEALTAAVQSQPVWLQAIEALLIADIGFYLAHRAFHAVPFLWRLHAIHHSIEEMDRLAAHRVQPVDQILTKSASFLPLFALGFSAEAVLIYVLDLPVAVGVHPLQYAHQIRAAEMADCLAAVPSLAPRQRTRRL